MPMDSGTSAVATVATTIATGDPKGSLGSKVARLISLRDRQDEGGGADPLDLGSLRRPAAAPAGHERGDGRDQERDEADVPDLADDGAGEAGDTERVLHRREGGERPLVQCEPDEGGRHARRRPRRRSTAIGGRAGGRPGRG